MRKEIDPGKLRTMIRSILPSRQRIYPHWAKAERKRKHRRAVRSELRCHDFEETAADLLRDVRVSDIVRDRRSADKLNHFMRWCEAITDGLSRQEALDAVRGILPSSLIGDHAFGHWEAYLKYSRRVRIPAREKRRRLAQSFHDSLAFRLHRELREDPSFHARLNAAIKAAMPFDAPRRLLAGVHDVEAFVHDLHADERQCERIVTVRLIAQNREGRPDGRPSPLLRVSWTMHYFLSLVVGARAVAGTGFLLAFRA
jgi:hypothetical protein